MEKGQGKGTDTLKKDNDFIRRGDVKYLTENTVCLHEELPAQIDIIPAADVVPVVRCKDCRKGIPDSEHATAYSCYGIWHKPDWFCAGGVRKVGDGDG